MSRQINQPINQVKLTNVAVVRMNRAGKRFEIACYRNKVMDYRAGLETDLSEVLQTERIFTNVSKGQFANAKDLEKAFGTRDQQEIAKTILEQSDKQQSNLQISDLERAQSIKDTLSQIATWVAANCVHSDEGGGGQNADRPFTISQIKHALGKNYTVHPHKPIKKQCLDAVKFLKTVIPIERAKMEIQLQYPQTQHEMVQAALERHPHRVVTRQEPQQPQTGETNYNGEAAADEETLVVRVDPSLYRDLSELMNHVEGRLEILEQVVVLQQGDMDLEQQLEQQQQQQQGQQQSTETPNASNKDKNGEEDNDSDVEDLVERLQTIRDTGTQQSKDTNDGGDEDEEDEEEENAQPLPMSRKEQKKNRKKNKKQRRRELEEEEERQRQQQMQAEKQQQQHPEEKEAPTAPTAASQAVENNAAAQQQQQTGGDAVKSCNTCGGAFANAAAYRAHFRSDWHRFNQKLKLKGVQPVTEEEFLLCDADTFFNN